MAEVPTIDDSVNEPQAHVMDQLLGDPTDSGLGYLLPNRPSFDLNEYLKTHRTPVQSIQLDQVSIRSG